MEPSPLVDPTRNLLLDYFLCNHNRNRIFKWLHYFEVYHRHFQHFRNKPIVFVEVGIRDGGSLQMWRYYFGEKARIIGIDKRPKCKMMEDEGFEVWIGNQGNPKFWDEFIEQIGQVDIFVDDGSHMMDHLITTFSKIFPILSPGGLYVTEDVHTSYQTKFGGGYRKRTSFIEFAKDLIDEMNAWHSLDNESFTLTDFSKTLVGMHIYGNIMVFERGTRKPPIAQEIGIPIIDP